MLCAFWFGHFYFGWTVATGSPIQCLLQYLRVQRERWFPTLWRDDFANARLLGLCADAFNISQGLHELVRAWVEARGILKAE